MNNNEDKILEHIVSRLQADRSIDAPDEAVRYAKNLFRSRVAQREQSPIRRLIAAIKADLAPGLAFGERHSGSGPRQMLFTAGEAAVDLRISETAKGYDLRGQVLGKGFAGGDAALAGGGTSYASTLDEAGAFAFKTVKKGTYSLTITGEAGEIVIEELTL